ncbi:MAG: hypothetical protein AB8B91_22205 [Rubripirellula sp.]
MMSEIDSVDFQRECEERWRTIANGLQSLESSGMVSVRDRASEVDVESIRIHVDPTLLFGLHHSLTDYLRWCQAGIRHVDELLCDVIDRIESARARLEDDEPKQHRLIGELLEDSLPRWLTLLRRSVSLAAPELQAEIQSLQHLVAVAFPMTDFDRPRIDLANWRSQLLDAQQMHQVRVGHPLDRDFHVGEQFVVDVLPISETINLHRFEQAITRVSTAQQSSEYHNDSVSRWLKHVWEHSRTLESVHPRWTDDLRSLLVSRLTDVHRDGGASAWELVEIQENLEEMVTTAITTAQVEQSNPLNPIANFNGL